MSDFDSLLNGDANGLQSIFDAIGDDPKDASVETKTKEEQTNNSELNEDLQQLTEDLEASAEETGSSLEGEAAKVAKEYFSLRSKLAHDVDDIDKIITPNSSETETEEETDKEVISSFTDEYEFLSNGYKARQSSRFFWEEVDDDGETDILDAHEDILTVENGYQASKTFDRDTQIKIRDALTPQLAKRLGTHRSVPIKQNWDSNRLSVMKRLVEDKFSQNFELKCKLLKTKDAELVQGNCKDTFWGVDRSGNGDNNLGKILMEVRSDILRNEGDLVTIVKSRLDREGLSFVKDWLDEKKVNENI